VISSGQRAGVSIIRKINWMSLEFLPVRGQIIDWNVSESELRKCDGGYLLTLPWTSCQVHKFIIN